ncbi:MAG: PAS domain-containing protein, partial [Gammaproteobacteria bacterium]|nr:PAS domain-containing protein [Gammaproteobacteria bacterium]
MSAKPVSPNLAAPEILARLLGLHERLQSLTETSRIQATVIEILVAIPGVANAEFHSPSETQTHAPPHNGETTHEFPLRVGNWHKLDLLIHVSDPEQFAAYRPFMGNIAAIAAPHLAEHENAATQNRFQTLFEHSSQCIWLLSSEGIVLDVNPTALNCGNCAPVNVLGHRFSDGPWWQNQGVLTSTLNSGVSRAANGESVHFEVAIQGPSDTETLDLSLQPVMDPDGQVGMIIAEGRVITAMKAEERALEIQRKRLENIIDGTRVGTWEWNVQTGEVRFNSRWAEMLGYRLDELGPLGIGVWERLAHPDDLAAARLQLQSHFVGHIDHYDIEGRMRHRNGQWIWVQDRGRLISRTEEGAPLWMAGTHTDITERKNAELEREAAREETERLLEEAAESRRALLSILEDHRHTTEALKHSEAGLREAQRLAHMGSWRMDLNSKTLECSDEALQIFAIDRDAFQCDLDSIMNRIHPEDRAAVEIAYQDALDSHSTYEIFHRLLLPDGQIKYVHERGETEYDQHGKALHTSGTVQDVTELTRAEHALREINERSQLAGQLAYDLVYEWDATRDELHWHGDIDRLLGYPQGKLSQHMSEWLACIHPDDLPILKMSIDRHRRAAEAINIDYRVLHADGSYRHWNDRALPVLDGDGIPLRWVGVCSDITKRKLAEQALRRSEQQYRGVVEDTPVLICRFDPDGVLQFVNRAYGDYFNRRPEDLVGHNFLNLVPTQDRPEVLAKLRSLTPDAPTLIQEHRVVTGDGTMHWQRWTDRALFDRNGQVLAYQSTGEDITERKRHEAIAELQAKRAIAMLELPKFAESVDEREVLHQALHQMQSLTRSEIGFLYFVNNDQTSLRLAATSASTPISADESRPLKTPNAGLWADALRQRRPVIFNELLSESERRGLIT